MSRLSQVLEAFFRAQNGEDKVGPRFRAAEVIDAIRNTFDEDTTLAEMLEEPAAVSEEPPKVEDLMAALEASLAAVKTRRAAPVREESGR